MSIDIDDRITCSTCLNRCKGAPVFRRCPDYAPNKAQFDQRNGAARWPNLHHELQRTPGAT